MQPFTLAIALVLSATAASPARAQEELWTSTGLENDTLGSSVAGGHDLDGDGVPDVIAGGVQNSGHGVVRVFSGADGALIYELLGEKKFDQFGLAVASLPDVDGDELGDFVVGARYSDWKENDAGSAYLYSGAEGRLIHVWRGQLILGEFGNRVVNLGDLTGDGLPEVAIAARKDWTVRPESGAVYIYSTTDFSLVRAHYGPNRSQPFFGSSLAPAGDVDGDGLLDLLVGSPNDSEAGDRAGTATVYSGADGSVLHHLLGAKVVSLFGTGVGSVGDVDGDGHADFAIGAPLEDLPVNDEGHAYVYSGATGLVLRDYVGSSFRAVFGASVGALGDVNGDGWDDYSFSDLTDTHGADAGAAYVYSGQSGRLLVRLDGVAAADNFGIATGIGDLEGDGRADFVVGAPIADFNGNASGAVTAYRGHELALQVDPDDVAANQPVSLAIRGGTADSLCAVLVIAIDDVTASTLLLHDVLDVFGEKNVSDKAPPGLSGVTFTLQAFANGTLNDHRPPFSSNPEKLKFK